MKIRIKETTTKDLEAIQGLWNNGEVMHYVGFPKGLGITLFELEKWLKSVNQTELCKHYSIYEESLGYCGETFYAVDEVHDLAALDIKLLPHMQGKGIAAYALAYTLRQVLEGQLATKAYVEPHPENQAAWKLYEKLGFLSKPRPDFLEPDETYLEITREQFEKKNPFQIRYVNTLEGVTADHLQGFFVGWPNPPSEEKHLEILKNSTYVVLALDEKSGQVVGFINALSDQLLSAYIPLLEVLPSYQGKGIGSELTKRMLGQLDSHYMIDLLCDKEVIPFYEKFNLFRVEGMCLRNYARQNAQ